MSNIELLITEGIDTNGVGVCLKPNTPEVRADSIVVVRILENSAPQPAQKFTPAQFLTWLKTQVLLAEQVHSCYEAGPFGFGLHRDLVRLGVRNLVVQPVCLDAQRMGVNHYKSDAKQLALRLDCNVAGNVHARSPVGRGARPQPAVHARPARKERVVGGAALAEALRPTASLAG